MKIRKGDNVQVMVGKDRGRQAKVEKVDLKEEKLFLSGINLYKKHRKGQAGGQAGEIVTLSRPVKAANAALICPKCKQITRVGFRVTGDKKLRICKKCKMEI